MGLVHALAVAVLLAGGPPLLHARSVETLPGVRHFDTEEGLLSSYVSAIACDSLGDLWVGTQRGLMRYDGVVWHSVSLPARRVLCAASMAHFGVIVGTNRDAYSFARNAEGALEAEVWTPFEHPYLRSPADSARREVYDLDERESDGAVWFATENGAKLYAIFEWIRVDTSEGLPADTVRAVVSVGNDTTWFGTTKGLFLWGGDTLTQPGGMPRELAEGPVTALAWDRGTASLWVGTSTALFKYARGRWGAQSGDESSALGETHIPSGRIHCLVSDGEGTLFIGGDYWLATYREEVRDARSHWSLIPSSHQIRSLALDRDGALWIGTYGGGLYRWPVREEGGDGWTSGAVTAMAATDSGRLIIASGGELWRVGEEGTFAPIFRTDRWQITHALAVTSDPVSGETVWVGSDNGAYGVRDGRIVLALDNTSILRGAPVYTLVWDRRGVLWIGAESGVWQLFPQNNRLVMWHRQGAQGGGKNTLYPVAETPDSTLWMGTPHGVFGIRGTRLVSFTHARQPDGETSVGERSGVLLGDVRYGTVAPDGTFWFGDDDGHVVSLSATADTAAGWDMTVFGVDDGVRGSRVRAITVGEDSSVWVATDGGVNRYRNGIWGYYGTDQGLRNRNAWIAAPILRSFLLVGTERGLEAIHPDTEPPETRIVAVPGVVSSEGILTAHFEGADRWKHTPTGQLRYRWRLDYGSWSPAGPSTHVTLSHLPPGRHVFEVVAVDGDLNADQTPAAAQFVVETPVWRRWYILLILAAFGMTIIYLLRRLRQAAEHLELHHHGGAHG